MSTEARASNLVDSDKESGKVVYGAKDEKIGKIERVMVDKTSGKILYAVLSFGGFLGFGAIITRCLGTYSDMTRSLRDTVRT